MRLIEISKTDYDILDSDSRYYFINGCIFERHTDNLIAFEWYESPFSGPSKYYKIVGD